MLSVLFALASATSPQASPATNTLCPVVACEVDAESPTLVVKEKEYRVCCGDCDDVLTKAPDTYLEKDGTPKNADKGSTKSQAPVLKTYLD